MASTNSTASPTKKSRWRGKKGRGKWENYVTGATKWVDTESALADKANSGAQALGEKLQTEPGKELQQAISANVATISEIKRERDYNQKLVDKTKAAMEALKKSYESLDKEYEAGETFLQDRRTELDNLLQMDSVLTRHEGRLPANPAQAGA